MNDRKDSKTVCPPSVYARATAAQIEKGLAIKMVRVTKEGPTYAATQNAPSLPADVGKNVHAIIGFQPFRHAYKHFRKSLPKRNKPPFFGWHGIG